MKWSELVPGDVLFGEELIFLTLRTDDSVVYFLNLVEGNVATAYAADTKHVESYGYTVQRNIVDES